MAFFLANSTLQIIGTSVPSSLTRNVTAICYDTDQGQNPGRAGAVITMQFDRPYNTSLTDAQIMQQITTMSYPTGGVGTNPRRVQVSRPGITGTIGATLLIAYDEGVSIYTYDTTAPSEPIQPLAAGGSTATLQERYCDGLSVGTSLFRGRELDRESVSLLDDWATQFNPGANLLDLAAYLK
ncbi:MAG: hypothetical protein IPJ89_03750 [Candidatus Iainarchaeum archaeon]|uniref:Uncharacterized protein n=1 Tax=Candidatus Iainarchaeum sp. TaxID=3101447 RepID=A0A7T9DJ90_9ARCH|nr:MAG: hypothetical protein IPJ89_03750 [Candidatus Diapherotrites archaeon]